MAPPVGLLLVGHIVEAADDAVDGRVDLASVGNGCDQDLGQVVATEAVSGPLEGADNLFGTRVDAV